MDEHQSPLLEWQDGVPVATRFGDPYYSLEDGLAEARYVFLGGNGLPGRFVPGFHIAELGFGTGLNLAAALMAWREGGVAGVLRFTSFEAYPLGAGQMAEALAAFSGVVDEMAPVLAALGAGEVVVETPVLRFELITGDARVTVPDWRGAADAWFLDGFAPARNPELWEPGLMHALAARTAPGGTAATFTAAGDVRRGLADAGFMVERVKGYGRKRHMTVARLP